MIVFSDHAGERVDRFIASRREDLSRSHIQKLISGGFITVNGKSVRVSAKLRPGDVIEVVVPEPEPLKAKPEKIDLDIVYEDGDIIVVNKPAGMVVHPSAGHRAGSLVNALLGRGLLLSGAGGVARPGIVHRLDKDTSGLLVVAKNDAAHLSLSRQLKDRSMSRTYVAIVNGLPQPKKGTIETNIGRHKVHRKKMAVLKQGGRRAVTSYVAVQRLDGGSLIEIRLNTGRTHQIRVHMQSIKCPVMGDKTYGRKSGEKLIGRQALHAWKLKLAHPDGGEEMSFTAPIPDDIRKLIERLGGDPAPFL